MTEKQGGERHADGTRGRSPDCFFPIEKRPEQHHEQSRLPARPTWPTAPTVHGRASATHNRRENTIPAPAQNWCRTGLALSASGNGTNVAKKTRTRKTPTITTASM